MKKRHGIILARSHPLKNSGYGRAIQSAMQEPVPELVIVPPHYDLYETCSRAFVEILREYSPCVEQYR